MKRISKITILVLVLLLVCAALPFSNAFAATSDGLTFKETTDGYIVSDCDTSITGDLTIPSTYNGKPVVGIGNYAFADCESLTNIAIPNSVTSIGMSAFSGCKSLTGITIPDSVTSIGDYAFRYCHNLNNITIPDSVTSIGNFAFDGCTSLTEITIPDSVTSIGMSAFSGCKSLTGITIPDSVTSIDDYAFYGCESLTGITIPDSVTSISYSAFYGCKSLTGITIPDSVTSIGEKAFGQCTNLETVYYYGSQYDWEKISIGSGNEALKSATIKFKHPATIPHSYTPNVVPPTCVKDGYTEYTCVCGDSYIEDYVDALGHDYSYAVIKTPTALDSGKLMRTCSRCSANTYIALPVLNEMDYTYTVINPATCTEDGSGRYTWKTTTYGDFSFDVTIAKTEHDCTETTVPPTCTEGGYTTGYCENCSYNYTNNYTNALGHDYSHAVTKTPTALESGKLTRTCSRCSDTASVTLPKLNTEDYTYTVITPATCTEDGSGRYTWKTTTYGDFSFDVTIAKAEHDCTETTVPPTCTEGGYTTGYCENCSYKYTNNYTNALGHDYSHAVTKAPTALESGKLTRTCSRCSDTASVTLPKLNTEDYTYTVITPATCTEDGSGRYTWKTTTYGNFSFDEVIASSGHNFEDGVCTECGEHDEIGKDGWVLENGNWYYYENNAMVTGWKSIGGAWYLLNTDGRMLTGWQQLGGYWYYMDASGVMKTGWQRVGNDWYYMDASGIMSTGWLDLNGTWYYLFEDGRMAYGDTIIIDGAAYTFDASGIWVA